MGRRGILGREVFMRDYAGTRRAGLPGITSIRINYSEKPREYTWPGHSHQAMAELYYVDKGRVFVRCGVRSYVLEQGQLALYLPGHPHGVRGDTRQPPNVMVIHFRSPGILRFLPGLAGLACRPLRLGGGMLETIAEMARSARAPGSLTGRHLSACLLLLLVRLAERGEGTGVSGMASVVPSGSFVVRVERHVRANIGGKLSIPALADSMGCSASYLCHRLKAQTGETPHGLVLRCRLERAKELLRDEAETVKEAAREAGFPGSSSLVRAFRRAEGVTPGTWRGMMVPETRSARNGNRRARYDNALRDVKE